MLLLCDAGKNPTEIADFLFCSRSSVYRSIKAYRAARLDWQRNDQSSPCLSLWQKRLRSLIKLSPRVLGWSCAALSMTLAVLAQIKVSRETVRLELKAADYVWKRAKLRGRDDDPERARRLARIRLLFENQRPDELILFADELDIDLLPTVGYQWMLKGTQLEIRTPGKKETLYVTGGHPARVERQDRLVEAVPPPLMFGDQLRLELTVAVTRDLDFDFRTIGLDFLREEPLRELPLLRPEASCFSLPSRWVSSPSAVCQINFSKILHWLPARCLKCSASLLHNQCLFCITSCDPASPENQPRSF